MAGLQARGAHAFNRVRDLVADGYVGKVLSCTMIVSGPSYVMASGALPPGFAAVEIDGERYWDGGLISNTPLQWVLDSTPRQDTLAFQSIYGGDGICAADFSRELARHRSMSGCATIKTLRHGVS